MGLLLLCLDEDSGEGGGSGTRSGYYRWQNSIAQTLALLNRQATPPREVEPARPDEVEPRIDGAKLIADAERMLGRYERLSTRLMDRAETAARSLRMQDESRARELARRNALAIEQTRLLIEEARAQMEEDDDEDAMLLLMAA